MRTTLTIDDDVAVQIERLRRDRDAGLKDIVNEVLRRGLQDMAARPKAKRPFRTKTYDMGKPLISMDNTAEVLAYLEGENFK